jgi:hypothetical protein
MPCCTRQCSLCRESLPPQDSRAARRKEKLCRSCHRSARLLHKSPVHLLTALPCFYARLKSRTPQSRAECDDSSSREVCSWNPVSSFSPHSLAYASATSDHQTATCILSANYLCYDTKDLQTFHTVAEMRAALEILLQSGEGQYVEYKSCFDQPRNKPPKPRASKTVAKDIAICLAELANADGGTLLLGVENDETITDARSM